MSIEKKILAVDDNPDNNAIVEELFEEKYDLRIAATGAEALEIATDFLPDLILLDIVIVTARGRPISAIGQEFLNQIAAGMTEMAVLD